VSAALRALARKYEIMSELRASLPPAVEPSADDRARLRALAAEFPGALRELDTLATDEIARRRDALTAAAAGGAVEDWMHWLDGYHAHMRAALAIKRALTGGAIAPDEQQAIARASGVPVDDVFVAAVAAPPHGRLNVVVFDRLAAATGVSAKTIWDTLFPPRKGDRAYRHR